jgi:hypothetical protein
MPNPRRVAAPRLSWQLLVTLTLAAGAAAFSPGGGVRLAAAQAKLVPAAPLRARRSAAPTMAFSPRAAAGRALAPLTRRAVIVANERLFSVFFSVTRPSSARFKTQCL